jgi:hypothetical protein
VRQQDGLRAHGRVNSLHSCYQSNGTIFILEARVYVRRIIEIRYLYRMIYENND